MRKRQILILLTLVELFTHLFTFSHTPSHSHFLPPSFTPSYSVNVTHASHTHSLRHTHRTHPRQAARAHDRALIRAIGPHELHAFWALQVGCPHALARSHLPYPSHISLISLTYHSHFHNARFIFAIASFRSLQIEKAIKCLNDKDKDKDADNDKGDDNDKDKGSGQGKGKGSGQWWQVLNYHSQMTLLHTLHVVSVPPS